MHMMHHFAQHGPVSHHHMPPPPQSAGLPFLMPTLHTPASRLRTTPGQTPSRTVPMHWSQQQQQQQPSFQQRPQQPYTLSQQFSSASKPQLAAREKHTPSHLMSGERSAEKAVSTMMPDKAGKGLERDLCNASADELVQILLDLASCNPQAAAFINIKAQLFALRRPQQQVLAEYPPNMSVPSTGGLMGLETPSKALQLDDSAAQLGSNASQTLVAQSPLQTLQTALHDRHVLPETRSFGHEMHPCIRLYGACRHSTNCPFKTLPKNVCVHWIRNSCTNMTDCPGVHRLPADCPVQVTMVFELSRGADRTVMAEKAQSLMLASEPALPESRGGLFMDQVDPEECVTPRGQRTAELVPGSAIEVCDEGHDGSREVNCARCLNDSLELAAADLS